jgi:predicted transposase YdaD
MEAKRRALDEIAARQRAADERRMREAGRQQQASEDGFGWKPALKTSAAASRKTTAGVWCEKSETCKR